MIVESEVQVVEAVRTARERRTTLEIVGGGTRRAFGRPIECDAVLDVSRLSGIVSYEPEELILTVKPGTPLVEIETLLSANRQRLGFDPQDWSALLGSSGTATIGGAISCNADGPAAIRHGRARDHLLGIRAVNGFGEAFKAGGRVVKNVTGFDLPKLMCGAMGTLGVLTELTFRVFPKPEASKLFAIAGLTAKDGLALLRRIWSSPLEASCLALLSAEIWAQVPQIERTEEPRFGRRFEEEPETLLNGCAAVIRLEGSPLSLIERESMMRAMFAELHPKELAGASEIMRLIGSGTGFVDTLEDVWLQTQPPSACPGGSFSWVADWAGSRIWMRLVAGSNGAWERKAASLDGGAATLVRASAQTRKRVQVFPPLDEPQAVLMHRVKAAFDPLGLFNPGRVYEGI